MSTKSQKGGRQRKRRATALRHLRDGDKPKTRAAKHWLGLAATVAQWEEIETAPKSDASEP